jgi:polyhydroxybutyrate depolymerase
MMKKPGSQLYAIIAVALLIILAACSQTDASPATAVTPTETSAPTSPPAQTLQPGDSERTLKVGDLDRSYLLHIPPGLDSSELLAVVFAFHGYSGDASNIQAFGFNETADKSGFLVVAPNGTGPSNAFSWNAGDCCGSAVADNVDESAFVRQILNDLGSIVKVDPKRVYATGFSNGAFLAYRLACEMADTFAAIAPVSGYLIYGPCQPQQPVSVIHIHGLADTVVPFAGDDNGTSGTSPSVDQSIATWVQLDGCNDTAQVEQQKNIITHTVYGGCKSNSAVELYTIEKQGHVWPSIYVLPASDIIWDFFSAHPKP